MKKKHFYAIILVAAFLLAVTQQAQASTRFIPSDTDIGVWDPNTRTYTLTTNVYETVQIDENDLTLDGAGHTVTGDGSGSGVCLYGRTGVTVADVNVNGFSYGFDLQYSNNNIITSNTASGNSNNGIELYSSSNNTVTGNIANNNYYGIELYESGNNIVTGNTANNNEIGIDLYYSHNNTITGNTASNNGGYGISLWSSSSNFNQ